MHEKVILGNRVPIETDELMNYIIDGIPDGALRDQPSMQCFATIESLLEAFEMITLRDGYTTSSNRLDKRSNRQSKNERNGKAGGSGIKDDSISSDERKKTMSSSMRCFNCSTRDHIQANCPSKALGAKCFECGKFGHIAAKCAEKSITPKSSCVVVSSLRKKYTKCILIDDTEFEALIDTGSDISLMHADEYVKMGSPRFQMTNIRFSDVGSDEMTALGEFRARIVDGHSYPILIRVVSDTVSRQKLLIGTDFLDTVEVNVRRSAIAISPIGERPAGTDDLVDIFQIDVENVCDANEVDTVHIRDAEYKSAVATLVENYKPSTKLYETDVKMTIVLTDDEPVYQRARRLSPAERSIVNNQVREWERQGIIRPSSSDYASPIVLVKNKEDSYRLCVDYRLLNRKIIKDRYPLPLIEDQLDGLQNVKIFSTINLKNGFIHVRIDESNVKYTAFIVPDGQYEFLHLDFAIRLLCSRDTLARFLEI